MKKKIKGSFTIEAAVIVPIILLIFSMLINIAFFYHDKNIVIGLAHETLAIGSRRDTWNEKGLEDHFASGIKGKLLLFSSVQQEVQMDEEKVQITCKAKKGILALQTEYKMSKTQPEEYVREVRKILKMQEGIGKEE